MIIKENGHVDIICDKCGIHNSSPEENNGQYFYELGWILNSSGRKYKHICRYCQNKKQRSARDFVMQKFKS